MRKFFIVPSSIFLLLGHDPEGRESKDAPAEFQLR